MAIEVQSSSVVCNRCGLAYSRRKGFFPVSYAPLYKGLGYVTTCKDCIDTMYSQYLSQCNNAPDAVRQVCRKLDIYWSHAAYQAIEGKSTSQTMMTRYLAKLNNNTYVGKSYDDTLLEEGNLWNWNSAVNQISVNVDTDEDMGTFDEDSGDYIPPEEVIAFWGPGYKPAMYEKLEQRRTYWMSRLPEDLEVDIGTEAIIRQLCSLELDINRDRAAGRSVDKNVNTLNTLLGSAKLKPTQKKEDVDSSMLNTPMGVWLYRYENKRPLPEIDDNLKDVNGTKKYMFTWMGHVLKMLGIKNGYTKMYEEEIARLRVEKPEYDDEDDETLLSYAYSEDSQSDWS